MQGGGGGGGGVGSLLLMNPTILPSIPTNSLSFLPLTRDPSFIRVHTWSKSPTINHPRRIMVGKTGNQQSRVSSEKQTATAVAAVEESPSASTDSGTDVVRNFYGKINSHDLASVENLIADNCVYEDLIFPQPFVGRKAILQFFEKFTDSISTDLQFVIDDISDEDSSAVGVTWHLEWQGKPFPFSKGCSFYRLEVVNGKRQIIYGRDSVEPFIKPGETALIAIRGVTRLLERFPQLVDRF